MMSFALLFWQWLLFLKRSISPVTIHADVPFLKSGAKNWPPGKGVVDSWNLQSGGYPTANAGLTPARSEPATTVTIMARPVHILRQPFARRLVPTKGVTN